MKRNDIFMLSYILFIFISLIVRCFCDYAMWAPTIAAITAASWIFSIADIFHTTAAAYLSDAETFTPLLDKAEKRIEHIEGMHQANEAYMNKAKANGIELANVLSEGPILLSHTKQELTSIKSNVKKKHSISKRCKSVATPFTMLGFLTFFCTITFETINHFLIPLQDYLTVFAFGVILLTQYVNNQLREQHEELEKHYQEANDVLENLDETVSSGFDHLRREVMTHAD